MCTDNVDGQTTGGTVPDKGWPRSRAPEEMLIDKW